jgi:hypothetical protein
VQIIQALARCGRALLVVSLAGGVRFAERFDDRVDARLPQCDVEPDVRIRVALELGRREQAIGRERFGHGDDATLGAGEVREDFLQLTFQHQAGVEDHLRLLQLCDIGGGSLVEVRIDTGAHQRFDGDAIAADFTDEVGYHRCRDGDVDRLLRGQGRRSGECGKREHEPKKFGEAEHCW